MLLGFENHPSHQGQRARADMPRLHIHSKLLVAFVIVLLPVMGLLLVDFVSDLRRTRESILDDQFLTAQAVALQASETFDTAIGFGWAVSKDPLLQTLDPRRLDPHLKELVARSPLYDSIAVFDTTGLNRGWSNPTRPDEPRVRIGDRPYFQKVLATNAPVISEVLELRRPIRTGLLVSVPVHGPEGRLIGVFNVVMRTDLLEQRYAGARLRPGQSLLLADMNGRLAFHTGNPELSFEQSNAYAHFEPLQAALSGNPSRVARFTSPLQGDERLGAFVPVPQHPWAVGVTVPRDIAMAPLYKRTRTRLTAFAGILLLNTLLAAWLARFYARPVRQLQKAAQALGRGEMERRVRIATGDELEELGTAFNEMAAQIARREAEVEALREQAERQAAQLASALRLREEFMSAAAHELKTPVTTIQTWAELLLNLEAGTARQRKGLATITRNTRRISRLVEHLFAAVRMAPGPTTLERQHFDLHVLVREQGEKLARSTENPLHLEATGPLFVHAERQLLGEVVAHLLDNALVYSPTGEPLELRAWSSGGEALVSVHDRGPGIPPERQPYVFEPLYEPLPPGAMGYTGVVKLGLHLSRRIIEAHGGRIWVESVPGEGSTFIFSLPLSEARDAPDTDAYHH
jgi:signal transduction histidine kinase